MCLSMNYNRSAQSDQQISLPPQRARTHHPRNALARRTQRGILPPISVVRPISVRRREKKHGRKATVPNPILAIPMILRTTIRQVKPTGLFHRGGNNRDTPARRRRLPERPPPCLPLVFSSRPKRLRCERHRGGRTWVSWAWSRWSVNNGRFSRRTRNRNSCSLQTRSPERIAGRNHVARIPIPRRTVRSIIPNEATILLPHVAMRVVVDTTGEK